MAYWVNREFYPMPTDDSCVSPDIVHVDDDEMSTKAIMALSKLPVADAQQAVEAEISALSRNDKE